MVLHVRSQIFSCSISGNSGTTPSFPAVGAGNTIVVPFQTAADVNLLSVVDNLGNSSPYIIQGGHTLWDGFGIWVYLAIGLQLPSGVTSLTFNFDGAPFQVLGGFDEFSTAGAINSVSTYAESDGTNPSIGISTDVSGCVVESILWSSASAAFAPAGYAVGINNVSVDGLTTSYAVLPSPGTFAPTWSQADAANIVAAVALAPGGPATASGVNFVTNVPQPTFGATGVVLPTEDAILTGVQLDLNTALGGNVNPQLTSPTGQIATTEAAVIGDSNVQFLYFINGVDPATSSGRLQDAIGRIYFMSRIPGQPTIQPCACVGLEVDIPVGALAQDPATELLWVCQQDGTIPASGSVTLDFACTTLGPIAAPASLVPYQTIYGWESATPTGPAVLGRLVETPAQFEVRRQASVAANSLQLLDSIQGTVLALPNVVDFYGYDNATNEIVTVGGVTLGPNSIYVAVLGGDQTAVAMAIWTKKGPGAGYNGNTFTTISDPNPAYNPPAPQYTVGYEIPAVVAFVVVVVLSNNPGVPSNALALIAQGSSLNGTGNGIIAGFNGLDGGSRAKIGSRVLASRYYGDVISLGAWAQIIDIQLGVLASGATFTGSISGTTLTVSAVASGALAAGQILQDPAGLIATGTLIVSGGGTTWVVSKSQSVSSEPMTATNLVNGVLMNINQAPAVSAANINLILQ